MPYKLDAWQSALTSSHLLNFLPPNFPSTNIHLLLIEQELLYEVMAGQMSGPFTVAQVATVFASPFHSSPVGLVEKSPGQGVWCMIHHLSKCDNDGQSTNGWVDSDGFPSTYFSA